MPHDFLVKQYIASMLENRALVELSAGELAGYYLYTYPGNPMSALLTDLDNTCIPSITGYAASVLLQTVAEERKDVCKQQ